MNESALPAKFLDCLRYERGYSPLTVEAYARDLRQFLAVYPDYLNLPPRELENYAAQLRGLNPATTARKLAALKAFYKFLYQEEIIAVNPAQGLVLPKLPGRLPKALSRPEAGRILNPTKTNSREQAILELLYSSGIRVSELIGIKLTDLDTTECFLKVKGKGSKERLVPLSATALQAVKNYLTQERQKLKNPAEELFLSHNGRPLTRQLVWQMVHTLAAAYGLHKKVSPHTFRHSLATHLIEKGADIRTVQEILGHANIATTQIYTSVSREHLRRVYAKAHPRQE